MAWITLSETHILTQLSGPENTAYRNAALAAGQGDPLPGILAQVTREVRARVAACRENRLGAGQTIPDELLGAAIDRARWELITRLPINTPAIIDTRRTANENALALLRDVAACRFSLEQPADISPEITSGRASPSFAPRTLNFGRDKQDGI
jgi:hypothetical protein